MRGKHRNRRSSSLSRRSSAIVSPHRRRLLFESLEDRRMLATFAVTNLNDFGPGSLRQAIVDANNTGGADNVDLTGVTGTINVALGEMAITDTVTLEGPGADQLIIDAGGNSRIFNFDTSLGDFTINGLTLTGGRTTGNAATFANTSYSGGAIRFLSNGNLTLEDSIVTGNTTSGDRAEGGAIFAEDGHVQLTRTIISHNSTTGYFSRGGALKTTNGSVTLVSSTLTNNRTVDQRTAGGGIYVHSGTVTLTDSEISKNTTAGDDSDGGAVFQRYGSLVVSGSTVSGNVTGGLGANGGGLRTVYAPISLINSTVSGNRTDWNGVGSSSGGGIFSSFGDVTVISSTITGNSTVDSDSLGAGIFLSDSTYDATLTITNSIVAGNNGTSNPDISPDPDGALNVNYSLIGVDPGGLVGVGNITGMQPSLGPLAFNGGPTQTHALLAGSLGIDVGDPGIVFSPSEYDQRGVPFTRVADGGGGLRVDMGAFERQNLSGTLVVDTAIDESDGDFSVGDLSLREAVELANGTDVDTIEFDSVVFGTLQTILLELGEIQIGEGVTIDGPGAELLTIDAQQNSRIFNVISATGDVTLRGMTLTGGRTTSDGSGTADLTFRGGAVRFLSSGTLTIEHSVITQNGTTGDYAPGGAVASTSGDVVITGGTISENSTLGTVFGRGGGIFTSNGDITVIDSNILNNSTAGLASPGGGISSATGNVMLQGSTLSGNSTSGISSEGGGIYAFGGTVTITDSTVSGNSTSGPDSSGGGVFDGGASGTLTLTNSIVSNNHTAGYESKGGGLRVGGDLIVNSSTISGNFTLDDEAGGGGAFVFDGFTMNNSRVFGNYTEGNRSYGGGIVAGGGPTVITNSNFDSNSTAGSQSGGGGIITFAINTVTFNKATVSGNRTLGDGADGGGIYVVNAPAVTFEQSTIATNSTAGTGSEGGGIFVNDTTAGAASLTIRNTIVAKNSVGAGSTNPDLFHDPGGVFDPDYSLFGNTSGLSGPQVFAIGLGNGNLANIDPLLGPLAYNGGPTKTHALLPGSPALDAGDPSIASSPTEFDQRGDPFLRVRQATQGGSLTIDIGAYERQGIPNPSLIVDTAIDESDGDYSVGDLSLREALGLANGDLGANTITFDTALRGSTINLVLGQLEITDSVTIIGLGADMLTIDAQQDSRVIDIDDGDNTSAQNVTISGLTFTGGRTFGSGGGIRVRENFELVASHVTNNQSIGTGLAGTSGGGIDINTFSSTTTTITSSTISGNFASGNGGGVRVASYLGHTFEMTNSTLSDNISAISGGGIALTGNGDATIDHSTIAFNTADADASGPFGGGAGGGLSRVQTNVTLDHTIVGSNTDAGGPDEDLSGTVTANYSLIGNTTGATINGANNILNQDPRLAPLADNGGPTPTHSLLPISPALGTGNIGIAGAPTFDQRGPGFARIVGTRIDRGALEIQAPSADFDFDGDVDGRDFLHWQRGYGTPMPLATKNDGDADNDTDVDLDDLLIWQAQYGTSGLLAVSSEQATSESIPAANPLAELRSEVMPGAELLDLALTVEWLQRSADENTVPIRDDQPIIEAAFDAVFSRDLIIPTNSSPDTFESMREDLDIDNPSLKQWLSDELLERVFG